MATENQIGKIIIEEPLHDKDNRFGDPRYDRGGAFIEDFQPHMWLEFCERWLHLAGYADLIDDIIEYYNTQAYTTTPLYDFRWENGVALEKGFMKVNGLGMGMSKVVNLEKPFIKRIQPDFTPIKMEYLERKMAGKGVY